MCCISPSNIFRKFLLLERYHQNSLVVLAAVSIHGLTLMLLVANMANKKTLHLGTHLRVLSESYPININVIRFRWFSKFLASLCFGRK